MKVGDLVRNVMAVRTNPAVWRADQEVGPGHMGIVLDVRPDTLNKPPMSDYVDVMLSVDGGSIRCGNYGAGFFKVVA
jgi:hypothetical protein